MADRTVVSSQIYNLAGDETGRPNFLKSLVMGGVMQGADSLGRVIAEGYRNGPAIKFRNFMSWARKDPEFIQKIGLTQGSLKVHRQFTNAEREHIKSAIPLDPGVFVDQIEMVQIGAPNINFWVLQYLMEKSSGDLPTDYTYKYDKETKQVTITHADGSTESFVAQGYVPSAEYLYVRYLPAEAGPAEEPSDWSEFAPLPEGDNTRPLDGWKLHSHETQAVTINLKYRETTKITYSSIFPEETHVTESTKPTTLTQRKRVYYRDIFKGRGPGDQNSVYSERQWRETHLTYEAGEWAQVGDVVTGVDTLPLGITRTTKTTRERQSIKPIQTYRETTSIVVHKVWGFSRYFIYRRGSGNPELDKLFEASSSHPGSFYPPIPFRYDNKPVGPPEQGAIRWWVDLGVSLEDHDPHDYEIQVAGGPISRSDPIPAEIYVDGSSPRPTRVMIGPKLESREVADHRPLSLALKAKNASYRIQFTWGERTDWVPFIERPEAVDTTTEALSDIYPICKKAFRKAFGGSFDEVQNTILSNKSINNIDYAYAVLGVSFNVKENACRKYVYKFFQSLLDVPTTSLSESQWFAEWNKAARAMEAWQAWKMSNGGSAEEPKRLPFPEIPWQELKIESVHEGVSDYRTDIKWAFIREEISINPSWAKSEVKPGELWFQILPTPITEIPLHRNALLPSEFNQQVALCWRESDELYRRLVITGLHHINHIYKDLQIVTTAEEALKPKIIFDPDSEGFPKFIEVPADESPFIVPLHEDIYRSMTMVDATQMATACCFLVFNCYEIYKEKWYETWWFKVIVIGAIIGISIIFAFFSGGSSLGIGGKAVVSLLVSAGLSTPAALIMVSVANVFVGMLVAWLISEGSTALFGEKWGPLVGALVGTLFSLGMSVGSLTEAIQLLGSPQTWVALGMATGGGVANYLSTRAQEIAEDTAKLLEAYNEQSANIQRLYNEMFQNQIDPTIVNQYVSEVSERPENFLKRTLLTGSDIVELTLRFIDNFVEDRLSLEPA